MVRGDHKKNTPSDESQNFRVQYWRGQLICSGPEDYRAARVMAASSDDASVEDVIEVLATLGIYGSAVRGHKAHKSDPIGPLKRIAISAGR